MRIIGLRLYNLGTKLFSTELCLKREICCAARPGERCLCVWAGEGKGAQPAMMLPSVLMMASRCLTLWEQMGLLCMSAFPCVLHRVLLPGEKGSVSLCLFTEPSGTRRGVKSCCVEVSFLLSQQLFFIMSVAWFSITAHVKKRKRYWLLFIVDYGGFGAGNHLFWRSKRCCAHL